MSTAYASHKAWRKKRPDLRNAEKLRNYRKGAAHLTLAERSTRRLWTEEEDQCVLDHVVSDAQLAVAIRRSVFAIQLRRSRLKKGSA